MCGVIETFHSNSKVSSRRGCVDREKRGQEFEFTSAPSDAFSVCKKGHSVIVRAPLSLEASIIERKEREKNRKRQTEGD